MPAKLKLTYALVEQIVELKRDGLCDADIIAAIGVHQATFYRWLKEGENAKTGCYKKPHVMRSRLRAPQVAGPFRARRLRITFAAPRSYPSAI